LVSSAEQPVFGCASGNFPLSGIYLTFESQAAFATPLRRVSRPQIAVFEIDKRNQSLRCSRQSAYDSKCSQQKIMKSPFQKKSRFLPFALYNASICLRPVPPLQNGSSQDLFSARPLNMHDA
jgi:hypothetical protein